MVNQAWLEEVQRRLTESNLPPTYIQRCIDELDDHLEDITEENMSTDTNMSSRLGDPKQVAEAAIVAYRQRSFLGRHPTAAFLVFAISPVISQWFVLIASKQLLAATVIGRHAFKDYWIASPFIVICSTFVSIFYSELAVWLGIGKKWALASYAVLGAIAMLYEFVVSLHTVTVMLLVQFAVPFAVGWWLAKQKYNHRYAATKFLVFAISPVALYSLVTIVVLVLTMPIAQRLLWGPGSFIDVRFGFAACILLLVSVGPTVVVSLLYCKLVRRLGIDWKWAWVACTVLAVYAATQSCRMAGHILPAGLTACVILAPFLVPLTIGSWVMRRMSAKRVA